MVLKPCVYLKLSIQQAWKMEMDIVITPCCIHIICYVLSAILRKSMHASWWIYVDNVANMTHGTRSKEGLNQRKHKEYHSQGILDLITIQVPLNS